MSITQIDRYARTPRFSLRGGYHEQ
jgi:hypothetical protein